MPLIVIISLIILINLYAVLLNKNSPLKYPIGKRQFELLKAYMQAESALFYIDQSAKYSAQQAVYELANQGGYYDENDCGSFQETSVWAVIEKDTDSSKVKECYPSDKSVKENFKKFFNEILADYLANYPEAYVPTSYDYELNGNLDIIGKAKEKLVINIIPENFVVKPKVITTTDINEIYKQAISQDIPQILKVPMKSNPDIETIKQYYPEVWSQYVELCKRMGFVNILGNPPGSCKDTPTKCCITSGYRHPAYNKEIGGATNSAHQYGVALDIKVGRGLQEQLKWAIEASNLFTRIGIYPSDTHIHVDLMPPKGEFQTAYWIGYKGTTIAKANDINGLESEAKRIGIA